MRRSFRFRVTFSCKALILLSCLTMAANGFAHVTAEDATQGLHALFERERAFYYSETPGTGSSGRPAPRARSMQRVSAADEARRMAQYQQFKDDLHTIERSALSEADQVNYDMFAYLVNRELTFGRHKTWRIPFVSDSGFHTAPTRMWRDSRFASAEDFEAYIAHLADVPRYLREHQANLEAGIKDGFTMPKVVLDGLLPTFDAIVVDHIDESSFFEPFKNAPTGMDAAQFAALKAQAEQVIMTQVMPAYRDLAAFMRDTYYPAAQDAIGASALPGGQAYYADMVKFYTTVDITPDAVHALGLKEVARIRAEMETIIKELNFKGSFKDFVTFLRTDPQFYAKSERELLMFASFVAKKIDGRLPSLFGKLPRQPYGVEAVPAAIAPNYTTGRYAGAPLDAPRGGYYWVNTYALDKRPLYTIPALTLHEGMPGHHLQIALSKELTGVPDFRLGLYPNAFGEGWGLYSEFLGLEMGIYETPYEQFGRLTYEMWRACRLVIDTGIHAMGWTRDEAIALLEDNSALSTHNIRTEVDRYISWPGQALAYKMGELKFKELRTRAETMLGQRFDVRSFHDEILAMGGVPLYLVEARIDSWIAKMQKAANAQD